MAAFRSSHQLEQHHAFGPKLPSEQVVVNGGFVGNLRANTPQQTRLMLRTSLRRCWISMKVARIHLARDLLELNYRNRRCIDTATPNGRLMLNLLGSIAQFEREIMLERQREGIAKAKAEGKYRGRKPTKAEKVEEIRRLVSVEGLSPTEAAKRAGVARATAYRVLKVA